MPETPEDEEHVLGNEPVSKAPPTEIDTRDADAMPPTPATQKLSLPSNVQEVEYRKKTMLEAYLVAVKSEDWGKSWQNVARMAEEGLIEERMLSDADRNIFDYRIFFKFMAVRGRILANLDAKRSIVRNPEETWKHIKSYADVLDTDDAALLKVVTGCGSSPIFALLRKIRDEIRQA